MPTLYDQVLYPNTPFRQTHPDRLASLAILFGMTPPPVPQCRVLEVGCGDGGNLIPMAFEYPGSQFLGVDTGAVSIGAGRREIETLGLSNIRLEQMDLMDAGTDLGTFDYVIAHGFYSWVPEPVRDKFMALTKAILAPQGVAYVSYNVLPGGRIRQMFREMMLFHLRGETEFGASIGGARQMVQWFRASQPQESESSTLIAQVESVMDRTPQVLFHDELNPDYYPVYFQEFAAHAARSGLQFLSEANYFDSQPRTLPADVVAEIEKAAKGDRIVREQYFDFMRCRMFRQTLLCHQEIVLPAAPLPARLEALRASSTVKPVSKKPDLSPGVAEEFRGWKGTGVTAAHPLTKAVMLLLGEAWPQTVRVSDLSAAVSRLTGEPADPEALSQILLSTYAAGVIDLHTQPRQCVAHVSQFPVASELARSQVSRGKCATTALHAMMEAADERICAFIGLLDGTRDLAALVRELAPTSHLPEAELARGIQENLKLLAERGLLIA
uniref:Methyltransferase type 12 n=1 Tax=Solibacter usitatus (strain Ellin6076) TaxID=234267 RepID=Q02CH3_SOLUE